MAKKQLWANRIVGHGEESPDQLLAHPDNWRVHPKAQQAALAGAISDIGYIRSVTVNRTTGHVLDGHLRVALALRNGEPTIPVEYVELSEREEAEALATLDPIAVMAGADKEKLDALLREVQTSDVAVSAMLADLAKNAGLYLDMGEDADAEPQIDRSEELCQKWSTETGQLWRIGEHRLLCGDSTKREDVERVMGGGMAVCMWTDPPYGVSYVGKTADALTIENDGAQGLPELLANAFGNAQAILEPGSPFYVTHPPGALQIVFLSAVVALGWQIHEQLVWVKDRMVLGHSDYHYKHEPILYGYVPGPGRSGRGDHAGSRWYGDNSQVSIFEIPRPKRSEEHPTMKPPELVSTCLSNSTPSGAIVYEPFAGSGTTIVSCQNLGRRCRAIEISPAYCAVILERMATAFPGIKIEQALHT